MNEMSASDQAGEAWRRLSQVAISGAEYDSAERLPHPKCLPGTRVKLLDHSYKCLNDTKESRIVWVHGTAGVGKSAVAFTVAERMRNLKTDEEKPNEKRLAGTFFFSRGNANRSTTGYFFATLAYQLARNFPSVKDSLMEAIGDDPALLQPTKSPSKQMESLFLLPLRRLKLRLQDCPPLVFVVDALDECTSEAEIPPLMSLLSKALRDPGIPVTNILVTSRSEAHVSKAIRDEKVYPLVCEIPVKTSADDDTSLISLDGADVDGDIVRFLKHSFVDKQSSRPGFPQPTEQELWQLAKRAGRRFIIATTMMKFIDDEYCDPYDRLQLMLNLTCDLLPGTEAYELYNQILSTCTDPERAYLHLSVVAALVNPLPASQISELLGPGQGKDVEKMLGQLRSIMDIPTDGTLPVKIYHSSVRDYVLESSTRSRFEGHDISPHSLLASSSLRLMMRVIPESTGLQDGLSELSKQSGTIDSHCPKDLMESLAFTVEPPTAMGVLVTLMWIRGDRSPIFYSWLDEPDGRAWLQTHEGLEWLDLIEQDWLQTDSARKWLQTDGGQKWLQTDGGQEWLQTDGGQEWLQTNGGQEWLQTDDGKEWLQIYGKPEWLQTWGGSEWLQTNSGQEWLQTWHGSEWLQTNSGQEWLQTWRGRKWLQTNSGQEWLQTNSGQEWLQTWLQTNSGQKWLQTWLQTNSGQEWLQTNSGQEWLQTWLQTNSGHEWLQTWGGSEWLQTNSGQKWLQTWHGSDWLQTNSGQTWLQTWRGSKWLQTNSGQEWLQTWRGSEWLQTNSGHWQQRLQTNSGHWQQRLQTTNSGHWQHRLQMLRRNLWLQTDDGILWLQTDSGSLWLQTDSGKEWLQTWYGYLWLQTDSGREWLQTDSGREWLQTDSGREWLQTDNAREWLQTDNAREWLQAHSTQDWLQTHNGQEWLRTDNARLWLQSDSGKEWLNAPNGQAWMSTPAASLWVQMQEFLDTVYAINTFYITPQLSSHSTFQIIQRFRALPDFLMLPTFLALTPNHPTSATSPHCSAIEILRVMSAFVTSTNEARKRSQLASGAVIYACQNWGIHLFQAPNPWNRALNHEFSHFWEHYLSSWLEMQWCLNGLQSCLTVLSKAQMFVKQNKRAGSNESLGSHKKACVDVNSE